MIIGITGKKGSGKDTVAKMLQYCFNPSIKKFYTLQDWLLEDRNGYFPHSNWKIKKFAYGLKQILSIITGIPVEDFEKDYVKRTHLGPEWDRFVIKWYNNSPKDWADQRTTYHGSFEECLAILKEPKELLLSGESKHSVTVERLTIRELLQIVGTDLFRNKLHPNTWVNLLMSQYKDVRNLDEKDPMFSQTELGEAIFPKWIISDVRFQNEVDAIVSRKGLIIKIIRNTELFDSHESENALNRLIPDYTILNNSSIEKLFADVKNIADNLGIV